MAVLGPEEAFHLLVPSEVISWEVAKIIRQARSVFDADLEFVTEPGEAFSVDVAPMGASATRVGVQSVRWEDVPLVQAAALRGVEAIGGAGFDLLVPRTRRVVQIAARVEGDARSPLALAGVLASVLLAPIVPPDEITIYGLRGAHTRLAKRGWPRSAA